MWTSTAGASRRKRWTVAFVCIPKSWTEPLLECWKRNHQATAPHPLRELALIKSSERSRSSTGRSGWEAAPDTLIHPRRNINVSASRDGRSMRAQRDTTFSPSALWFVAANCICLGARQAGIFGRVFRG